MSMETKLLKAIPVLATLNIERSIQFFVSNLGFTSVYAEQGTYGIVERDGCEVHFWPCDEAHLAENTSCRINVLGVADLFAAAMQKGIVHPNGLLTKKPWGSSEFTVLDPDGNGVTFAQFEADA